MLFDLIPLLMSGPFLLMGALVYYFLGGIDSYYRKHGKRGKGKVIAFKEETKTRSNGDGSKSRVTTVCPVIKFYNNGEEVIFIGSNQNYLEGQIGEEAEIYYIPGKKDHVIQKKNSYRIAKLIGLIFIAVALLLIYSRDADITHKILIPLISCSFFSLFLLKIKKTMKKRAIKEGKTGNLLQLIWEEILPNNNIIDQKELDQGKGYIKRSTELNLKKSKVNLFGILLSAAMLTGLYFLVMHIYTNRAGPKDRAIIDRFINNPENFQEILGHIGSNNDISVIVYLTGFSVIILLGFLMNLKGWLKSR
ncbi:MAG: hypothetical protein CME64_03185 [Halobacteriovoraceae bacterium]|nr:hypothetical protein [Halobacteriovoraceae bacterium]|tara:strand:+ start:9449 stop:10366 length:918 start_codon:yes stop_codon:yes gene_type:complete